MVAFIIVVVLFAAYCATVGVALGLLFLATTLARRWMSHDGVARMPMLVCNLLAWSVAAFIGGGLIAMMLEPWHPLLLAVCFGLGLFAVMLYVSMQGLGSTSLNYDVAVAATAVLGSVLGCLLFQVLHLQLHFSL